MKKIVLLFILSLIIFPPAIQAVTRYWIGGGNANFTDGTHWSLSSGGAAIGGIISWGSSDIALFDNNSGSPTVNFTATEDVGKLQISGSITVTFKPNTTGNRTLDINSVASDALTVASGSTLVISGLDAATDRDMHVALHSTTGVHANIYGTVKVTDDATGYGELSKGTYAAVYFNSGSTFEYHSDQDVNSIPLSSWDINSTCYITGAVSHTPGNPDQSFGNFTWECSGQNDLIDLTDGSNNPPYVQGNFWLKNTGSGGVYLSSSFDVTMSIGGNYNQSGGNFYPAQTSGNEIIYVGGNFSFTGGNLSCPGSGSCKYIFNSGGVHTYSKSSSNFGGKISFEVDYPAVFDMGTQVIDAASSGTFYLGTGAGFKTAHSQGIASTGASGCIQLTGTRSYDTGAYYTFYGSGAQATGTGFTAVPTRIVTIGSTANATTLTITNTPVTIINKLILVSNGTTNSSITSGTVSYGSTGTLEYQGASVQVTTGKEWPVSNPPFHVIINNPSGISLHEDRTINGTFRLSLGAFSIGSHTLTLNGTLTKSSGSLTGGSLSNIIAGGTSGTPLDVPLVTLGNLTINRPGGIRLIGNLTVNGILTLTNGTVSLNGFVISYGSTATLKYNGSSSQTTADPEFPILNGPFHLYSDNTVGVNLHTNRSIGGDLTLNKGTFAIGAHTLTLAGIFSINLGTITGGALSGLVFAPGTAGATLPGIELQNLTINRVQGVTMGGTVTIGGTLNLTAGNFTIGANTLNMNGTIAYGSSLTGGNSSNIFVGGSGAALNLAPIILGILTLNRSSGLSLTGNITVQGTFNMITGPLYRNGFTMYGAAATLRYAGITGQTTTDEEFPANNGPFSVVSDNPSGVSLHAPRTINGQLLLASGAFSIGACTLTISGMIQQTGGTLNGGSASCITIDGMTGPTGLPSVTLNTLLINRPGGIWLDGNVQITNDLVLTSGQLAVGLKTLTLNGNPISGTPGLLVTTSSSTLVFGGTVNGVFVPAEVTDLSGIVINNHNGVTLNGTIYIWGIATLTGYLICGDKKLNGPGGFIAMAGSKLGIGHPQGVSGNISLDGPKFIDSETDYEFNGTTDQETNFLPTQVPETIRNMVINNSNASTVTLSESMNLTGSLEIMNNAAFGIPTEINLNVAGDIIVHEE